MLLNISQASTKKSCTLAVGDEGAIADVDEYVVQELISPSAHELHREAPFACPDPEYSPFKMKGPVCGGTSCLNSFFAGALPNRS